MSDRGISKRNRGRARSSKMPSEASTSTKIRLAPYTTSAGRNFPVVEVEGGGESMKISKVSARGISRQLQAVCVGGDNGGSSGSSSFVSRGVAVKPDGGSVVGRGGSIVQQSAVDQPSTSSSSESGVTASTKNVGRGEGAQSLGRGGLRGKTNTPDVLTTRPEVCLSKKGTSGKEIQLLTNYFKLETVPRWTIFQYHVDFNIDEDREVVKKKWLREHTDKIGKSYIFDGTVLFSSRRLTQDNRPLSMTSIRESDNTPVLIQIRLVHELQYGNAVYLQVFNILVRRSLAQLKLQLIKRNYFDANASIKIPQFHLELWPGYITAIRQHERNILMCAEITHKVMRTDTVFDLLQECIKYGQDYKRIFLQSVIGEVVLTDYNNKTYRVDDVDFSVNPTSKFTYGSKEISYLEYYERRYQIRIHDHRQPLLISRLSDRAVRSGLPRCCLLVPELCRMTGLNDKMRENDHLMRGLSDYTRVSPAERIERLKRFNIRLHSKPEIIQEFNNWDMTVSKDLLPITGRELAPENIIGGGGEKYSSGLKRDWTKELRSRPMLKSAVLREWVVVCPRPHKSELFSFLELLIKSAAAMNFNVPRPQIYEIENDRPANLVQAAEDSLGRFRPDLIMFVCTNKRADRYNAIKKKCCVDRGIPSQVILVRSLRSKGVMSIATKVAVQLNCKLGGAPWAVDIPLQSLMVIGFDVYHDKSSKGKSYGAMVASLNKAQSAWYSSVCQHSNGEELSNSLSFDVCKALRKFMEFNNGALPAKIFIFRDGVGDGQLDYVFNHEVQVLKDRLTEIYKGKTWKLAFIIVTKRINTRFFKDGNNPAPGTVVDDVVTLPERYDFYLVSQNVNFGTVTPTSYNIISDNSGLTPDQVQRLTYKMTHLYYNWSGTIRAPAPCQYAHKLAFLVGQNLHTEPHPRLETSLYFL